MATAQPDDEPSLHPRPAVAPEKGEPVSVIPETSFNKPLQVILPPVIGFAPEEVEFLAEQELVGIVPNFSSAKLPLISGDVGPFRAGLPITVPLWLAILLCKRCRCRVIIPDWFDEQLLTDLKDQEHSEPTFIKMPSPHYMIVAKILFELCPGDIQNADAIKTLIKDIWDTRMSKLRTSIKTFLGGDQTIGNIDNLTMMEITTIRPFFPHSLDQIYRITKALNETLNIEDSQEDTFNMNSMSMSDSGPSMSQYSQ